MQNLSHLRHSRLPCIARSSSTSSEESLLQTYTFEVEVEVEVEVEIEVEAEKKQNFKAFLCMHFDSRFAVLGLLCVSTQ